MLDTTGTEQYKEVGASTGLVLYRPGPKSKLEQNFFEVLDQLRSLGGIQCTHEEAAAVLGVSRSSLQRFLAKYPEAVEAFEDGKEEGRASLRRAQVKSAMAGNTVMQVWLGKQWLGQRDKHEVSVDVTVRHENMLDRIAKLESEGKL